MVYRLILKTDQGLNPSNEEESKNRITAQMKKKAKIG
jgi:hypothetical protein